MKNAWKAVDIKPSYNVNNQKKTKKNQTIKTKRKENVILFGSIHHRASPLKPISGEYLPDSLVKNFHHIRSL